MNYNEIIINIKRIILHNWTQLVKSNALEILILVWEKIRKTITQIHIQIWKRKKKTQSPKNPTYHPHLQNSSNNNNNNNNIFLKTHQYDYVTLFSKFTQNHYIVISIRVTPKTHNIHTYTHFCLKLSQYIKPYVAQW